MLTVYEENVHQLPCGSLEPEEIASAKAAPAEINLQVYLRVIIPPPGLAVCNNSASQSYCIYYTLQGAVASPTESPAMQSQPFCVSFLHSPLP